MRVLSFGQTDVGMRRDHNEDSYLVSDELGLYVVADGMGGHAGGETASKTAIQTIHTEMREALPKARAAGPAGAPQSSASDERPPSQRGSLAEHPALTLLCAAVKKACKTIFIKAQEVPELAGMGTTCTGFIVDDGHAFFVHVGDSRAYLFRDGKGEQLSEYHSLVHEQVRAGLITEEQATVSRFKNIITRSVGFEEDVAVDTLVVPVEAGDCFLLCSDGLANYVPLHELADVVYDNFLRDAPKCLVDLANQRGGEDNITVVLVYVSSTRESEPAP